MEIALKLDDIIGLIKEDVEIDGDTDVVVSGFASIEQSQKGDLSFIQSKKYLKQAQESEASILLVPKDLSVEAPNVDVLVRVDDPSKTLSSICSCLERQLFPVPYLGIHELSILEENVDCADQVTIGAFTTIGHGSSIEEGASIGARVSVGAQCRIGKNVVIADNVVLAPYTEIGEGCIIHPGVVLGAPGFGYDFNKDTGCHDPIPQIGRVVVGKYVDIGANTTIDRARFGATRIGDGTKIDNMVQIGHNVVIGKHCILCAHVGISGSVTIGDYVVFAGKVGVADHLEIASGTQIGGGSAITTDVKQPGGKLLGAPAVEFGLGLKIAILQRKIPDLFKRVKQIEKKLDL